MTRTRSEHILVLYAGDVAAEAEEVVNYLRIVDFPVLTAQDIWAKTRLGKFREQSMKDVVERARHIVVFPSPGLDRDEELRAMLEMALQTQIESGHRRVLLVLVAGGSRGSMILRRLEAIKLTDPAQYGQQLNRLVESLM